MQPTARLLEQLGIVLVTLFRVHLNCGPRSAGKQKSALSNAHGSNICCSTVPFALWRWQRSISNRSHVLGSAWDGLGQGLLVLGLRRRRRQQACLCLRHGCRSGKRSNLATDMFLGSAKRPRTQLVERLGSSCCRREECFGISCCPQQPTCTCSSSDSSVPLRYQRHRCRHRHRDRRRQSPAVAAAQHRQLKQQRRCVN